MSEQARWGGVSAVGKRQAAEPERSPLEGAGLLGAGAGAGYLSVTTPRRASAAVRRNRASITAAETGLAEARARRAGLPSRGLRGSTRRAIAATEREAAGHTARLSGLRTAEKIVRARARPTAQLARAGLWGGAAGGLGYVGYRRLRGQ